MSDPVFESRRVQHFSLLRIVHIVYGTRPACYSMGTGMLLRGHRSWRVVLPTHLQT